MGMTRGRLAATFAGALLALLSFGPAAFAAPSDPIVPALPDAVYQNACVRERAEREAAEEQNREPQDLAAQNLPAWRRGFAGQSQFGPVPTRYCWFSDQFGPEDPTARD